MSDTTTTSSINNNLVTKSNKLCKTIETTGGTDVLSVLTEWKEDVLKQLREQLEKLKAIKWYIAVFVTFVKTVNNEEITTRPTFHGKTRALLTSDDTNNLEEQYNEAVNKILESMAKWVNEGSGWALQNVVRLDICTVKYHPLYASSYIPTPKKLSHHNKTIVNVKNTDNKCFLYSVLAQLFPDPQRHYRDSYLKRFEDRLNMTGITYPVKLSDIDKFETLNSSISVNVFGFENDDIYPLRITKLKNREHHVNLLMLSNNVGNTHYCLIGNLSKFLAHLTNHNGVRYYCNYCLHRFSRADMLPNHEPYCTPHGVQKTSLPEGDDDKWMSFKNYTYSHKVPFIIICDFESFVVPLDTCLPSTTLSHTTNVTKHEPSGFCYVIVDSEGRLVKPPEQYTGPHVVDKFLAKLIEETEEIKPLLKKNLPMVMTREDEKNYNEATTCHLCKKSIIDSGDKVRNHNHMSGRYLGAAHNVCNINYQVPQHIPVFFHNLRGYDCHHLIQGLGKFKEEKMSCIATTSERYVSVTLESLRFLDSLQFLNASLETLVANLAAEGPSKFPILQRVFNNDKEKIHLLLRKGVFPYSWMTDASKLDETRLPPQEAFYNDLTQTPITDEDYNHAQKVWTTFEMTSMRQYHDLYLLTDVLLLADVFESFRTTSINYYEIDPCNVYSAPGLAWNSMLKMTGVQLELLTDIDQHLFIEAGVRGGVAMIPHRHAKANNPLLPQHDASQSTSWLMYLDCNNLYGTAMSQPLPQQDFRWLNEEQINQLNITGVEDDAETGYILEVDLRYPEHLHDLHSDYPLAPQRMLVTEDMLSSYSKRLQRKLNYKTAKVEKLLTTLEDKKNYVLHYRNLKFYLQQGLELTRVHRVLAFTQSAWLAPFINFNTEKRKHARNNFEKDFFKLMNNATYGKSLENVRSRIDFKLVANEKQLLKWTASPRLKNFFAYNENLAGLSLKKQSVFLNKPVYVGLTVLDISKLIMYDFHYNWTVRKYRTNVKLCMTDTDSLFYHIKTANVYEDIKEDHHLFDTSDYPTDHMCYSDKNKKKLGKFKDEMNGRPPKEIVGLRAKCYSVLDSEDGEKKVAKGVPRTAIRNQLKHEMYMDCLINSTRHNTTSLNIRSVRHQIYTQHICKLSLSPYDDKRYILDNGVDTWAHGHYKIKGHREDEEGDDDVAPTKRRRL